MKEERYGILELPSSCNHIGCGKRLFGMYEQHNSTIAMYGLDLSICNIRMYDIHSLVLKLPSPEREHQLAGEPSIFSHMNMM